MIRWAAWGYLIFVVILGAVVFVGGDRWWPATLLLFGPRWFAALPLILLLPLVFWKRSWFLLIPLTVGAALALGPFMGWRFNLSTMGPSGAPVLRVVTCNLQNGQFDIRQFAAYLLEVRPDIVALQECPNEVAIPALAGWHHVIEGDLHIYSRFPLERGSSGSALVPLHKYPRPFYLTATVKAPGGDVSFMAVHLPSPRYGLQNILDRRTFISIPRRRLLIEETEHRRRMSREASAVVASMPGPRIVAGDFNQPVESRIYRDFWAGYANVFSCCGTGFGWTERDMPGGIPVGVRIDHLLVDGGFIPRVSSVGPDVGSDHLPVVADVARR